MILLMRARFGERVFVHLFRQYLSFVKQKLNCPCCLLCVGLNGSYRYLRLSGKNIAKVKILPE